MSPGPHAGPVASKKKGLTTPAKIKIARTSVVEEPAPPTCLNFIFKYLVVLVRVVCIILSLPWTDGRDIYGTMEPAAKVSPMPGYILPHQKLGMLKCGA